MKKPPISTLMAQVVPIDVCHRKLGHPHLQTLKNIIKKSLSLNMNTNVSFCNECVASKKKKQTLF